MSTLKRKREEFETDVGLEHKDCVKELQIKKDGNYHLMDADALKEIIEINNYNTISILFDINDTNFLSNIPSSINRLRLMRTYKSSINNIPDSITELEISSYIDKKINKLPKNLTHFYKKGKLSNKIDIFPDSLIDLRIDNYPHHLDNLPKNLKQLYIGDILSINNLPNQITHITILSDIEIEDLPESVKYLNLEGNFNHPIDNLPRNLVRLKIGDSFNHPINNLPHNLNELEIGNSFNQRIEHLPSNLEYIRFGKCYTYDYKFDKIPESVKRLDFTYKPDKPILSPWNKSLEIIQLDRVYSEYGLEVHLFVNEIPIIIKVPNIGYFKWEKIDQIHNIQGGKLIIKSIKASPIHPRLSLKYIETV